MPVSLMDVVDEVVLVLLVTPALSVLDKAVVADVRPVVWVLPAPVVLLVLAEAVVADVQTVVWVFYMVILHVPAVLRMALISAVLLFVFVSQALVQNVFEYRLNIYLPLWNVYYSIHFINVRMLALQFSIFSCNSEQ